MKRSNYASNLMQYPPVPNKCEGGVTIVFLGGSIGKCLKSNKRGEDLLYMGWKNEKNCYHGENR